MNIEELEARIKTLENSVRTLQDIEDIKKLQRAYGYYLQHGLADDLIDLFSDSPDTNLLIGMGEFRGKEGVRRFFSNLNNPKEREFFHQVMQLSGIVDIDPDGKMAKGRWYGFGACVLPIPDGGILRGWMNGVYENEYVKENGTWKIKKIRWCLFNYPALSRDTRIETSRQVDEGRGGSYQLNSKFAPDGPPEDTTYTTGFICPFHFKNPVSGR